MQLRVKKKSKEEEDSRRQRGRHWFKPRSSTLVSKDFPQVWAGFVSAGCHARSMEHQSVTVLRSSVEGLAPSRVLWESLLVPDGCWAETLLQHLQRCSVCHPAKNISHIQVKLFPFFPTSPTHVELKLGLANTLGRLLITNHLDQSLWLAN
jgi:hypothetical protein